MHTLDSLNMGRTAAHQIRSQFDAGVLSIAELDRLLKKVETAFAELTELEQVPLVESRPAGRAVTVIDGGRH